MMQDIEKEIREICTYYSELGEGTAGYSLSEEQFQKLFALLTTFGEEIIGTEQLETGGKILCDCDCLGPFCNTLMHQCRKPYEHYPQRDQALYEIRQDQRAEQRKRLAKLLPVERG